MHSDVARVLQQRVAKGGDEHSGAAHLGQGARPDIAFGLDAHQFNGKATDGGQLVRGLLALGEREFARAGTDPNGHFALSPTG